MLANIKRIEARDTGQLVETTRFATVHYDINNFKNVRHENTKASKLTQNMEEQLTIKLTRIVNQIKSDKLTRMTSARIIYGTAVNDTIRSAVEKTYQIGVDYVNEFIDVEGFLTDMDLGKIKEISNVMAEEFWTSINKNILTPNITFDRNQLEQKKEINVNNLMNIIASKITVMTLNLATINKTKQIAMRADSLNVVPKTSTFTAGKSNKPKTYFFSKSKMRQFLYAAADDFSFFSWLPSLNQTKLLVLAWASELDDRICTEYDCAVNHGVNWEVDDPDIMMPPLHLRCRCRLLLAERSFDSVG